MRLRCSLLAAAVSAALLPAAAQAVTYEDQGVHAEVTADKVVLGNDLVERTWTRSAAASTIVDRRAGGRTWSTNGEDFALVTAGKFTRSNEFTITAANVTKLARGGLRLVLELTHTAPILTVTRTIEAYPDVAGFRTETTVASPVPLVLSAVYLDELGVGAAAKPTIHAFRAGWDWRSPDWGGAALAIGDKREGDWRATAQGTPGQALAASGEWISAAVGSRSMFQVLERNDFPSSRAVYDGTVATSVVDFTRDIISAGPFEESVHAENPSPETQNTAGRGRPITAAGLKLPATFTGFGLSDDDEAWQFHKYLVEHRIDPFPQDVIFNSDGYKGHRISTGAKDDMDYATVQKVAPLARRMGADVFTLDDGWQAASGDWQPDSEQYPEPRGKFPPRFPDATFKAVREAIAPMKLGLWMSPMAFNPASLVYKAHPEWGCSPVGQATAGYTAAQPDSSSNEAGLGLWSNSYLPFLETRLREAIEKWEVKLFKFDFLVWVDCLGINDMYENHDAFLALIDELRHDYPDVAFAIDETNDYRLFPFESTLRGPTWFSNGGPTVADALHTTWTMSPWVPAFSLGIKSLTGSQRSGPIATSVAATLLNEQMVVEELEKLPVETLDQARPWFDWGKEHRDLLNGVVYPLLDDPIKKQWTALQSWDPEAGRGVLLAFRQDDARDSVKVALRNVPDGQYLLRSAPDDHAEGAVSGAQLRDGLTVTLPKNGAQVLSITKLS